jgi:hypothetical protein
MRRQQRVSGEKGTNFILGQPLSKLGAPQRGDGNQLLLQTRKVIGGQGKTDVEYLCRRRRPLTDEASGGG